MNSLVGSFKRIVVTAAFGAAVLFAANATANAQSGYYDPYYGQPNDGHYNQNRGTDKRHRKQEKREVKYHQADERGDYGNSRQMRRHQQQERRQVKGHQRDERYNGYNPYDSYRQRY